jgi:hypothetical protein
MQLSGYQLLTCEKGKGLRASAEDGPNTLYLARTKLELLGWSQTPYHLQIPYLGHQTYKHLQSTSYCLPGMPTGSA